MALLTPPSFSPQLLNAPPREGTLPGLVPFPPPSSGLAPIPASDEAPPGEGERRLEVDRDGRLELPAATLHRLRLFRPEAFYASASGRQIVHLVREAGAPRALLRSERLALFGEIEDVGIADVFSLLNMARLSGVLLVLDDTAHRGVHFRRGEIVFAESGWPEDRLGQILYRTGKLSPEGLRAAEAALTPDRRFGAPSWSRG
jgi:hypothetical protein